MPQTTTFRRVVATFVATTAIVAWLPSGAAAIGLTSVTVAPIDPRAGAHSDVKIDLAIGSPADDLRDLTLELPTGLLGNPSAAPRCSVEALDRDTCPAATAVGSTSIDTLANVLGQIPITAPGTVYNVDPADGQPARLGIVVRPLGGLLGKVTLLAPVVVRDEGDYGLTATITDIPNTLSGIGLDIRGLSLTLTGDLGGGKAFMTNPTTCTVATTRATITGRTGDPASGTGAFTPTDCDGEPFRPGLDTAAADARTDVPSAYTVALTQPADVDGRAVSHVRRAQIRLPDGVGFSPALAPGLGVCTDAELGAQGDPAVACPATSELGDVALDTPLLGTLPGKVYFGRTAQDPYRLLVAAQGFGVVVKLKGSVTPDPAAGQLTAVFDELPQVPFTRFALTFRGGDTGVLSTPTTCGTVRATAAVRPWSGGADGSAASEQAFSTGGDGTCTPTLRPTLAATTGTTVAKADTSLALDLVRPERDAVPRSLDIALPGGLLGRILDVPACPDAAATTGDCPAASRLGTVTATIGSGPRTVDLAGTAFLAGGGGKSLARIVLVIPATVGPIELGTFVLPTELNLGARDGRVHVTATLPRAFNGIPLNLRRLRLSIDRKGFLFGPSGCDARRFDATVTADGGVGATASAPFRATGCSALAFSPGLEVGVPSATARLRGDSAPLRVTLTRLDRGSGLRRVRLVTPRGLRAEVALLQRVCQADQLAARTCPASTKIGTAYARTPLLPVPLRGDVYIAQTGVVPRQRTPLVLPYAVAFLEAGPVKLRIDGQLALSPDGSRLDSLFAGLPDVPLDEFRLDFDKRAFVATDDLCSTTRGPVDAELRSQSAVVRKRQPPLDASACGQRAEVRMTARGLASGAATGRVTVTRNPDAGRLTRVEVRLPQALRPTGSRAAVRVRADGRTVSPRRWTIGRSGRLTVRVPGAAQVRVDLRRGSLAVSPRVRRAAQRGLKQDEKASLRLVVRGRGTDSGTRRRALSVRFDALARR